MSLIEFDVTAFRQAFAPVFDNTVLYSDQKLQGYFDLGTGIVTNQDSACYALRGAARAQALNLLVAHMAILFDRIADGITPGFETQATVDKISVTVEPPPKPSQFQWWLNLTGYGQMLLAMLQVNSVGGAYVGGLPERSGFRKVGGTFYNG